MPVGGGRTGFVRRGLRAAAASLCLLAGGAATAREPVHVTGRAAIGSGGAEAARRAALEDALYLAALEGGADLSGFSLAENGILVGETVILRPQSRILDFYIREERVLQGRVEIDLAAFVGPAPEAGCTRREIVLAVPAARILPVRSGPLWLDGALHAAQEGLVAALAARPGLRLDRVEGVAAADFGQPDLPDPFDYRSLMSGPKPARAAPRGSGLILTWQAEPAGRARLSVTVTAELRRPGSTTAADRRVARLSVPLGSETPLRSLDVVTRRAPDAVASAMAAAAAAELGPWLDALACRPLAAALTATADGRLRVPLGRSDGLGADLLGFVEGGETPFTVLRIVALDETGAVLEPLDSRRSRPALVGQVVRFTER